MFAGSILGNVRPWKQMERAGIRKEAHFREAHVPVESGGPWLGSVRYAILASERPACQAPRNALSKGNCA